MDRISNTLHRFGDIDTIVSGQIRAMIKEGDEHIAQHVRAFARKHSDVAFASIPLDQTENGPAYSITIYRDDGNIKVKTTIENYEPGSPHEIIEKHVQEMQNETHRLSQQKRVLDAQHMDLSTERHIRLLTDGTYQFPYAQVNRIANKLGDQGIGKATINEILDTLTEYNPSARVMVGFYDTYRSPLAATEQIEQITAAAEKTGLDSSVIEKMRRMLGTGIDDTYEIAKLSHEQATAIAEDIKDAGFDEDIAENILDILTTDDL